MGELIKFIKAWAFVAMATRALFLIAVIAVVVAVVFGDGGKFSVEWRPNGGANETSHL